MSSYQARDPRAQLNTIRSVPLYRPAGGMFGVSALCRATGDYRAARDACDFPWRCPAPTPSWAAATGSAPSIAARAAPPRSGLSTRFAPSSAPHGRAGTGQRLRSSRQAASPPQWTPRTHHGVPTPVWPGSWASGSRMTLTWRRSCRTAAPRSLTCRLGNVSGLRALFEHCLLPSFRQKLVHLTHYLRLPTSVYPSGLAIWIRFPQISLGVLSR